MYTPIQLLKNVLYESILGSKSWNFAKASVRYTSFENAVIGRDKLQLRFHIL